MYAALFKPGPFATVPGPTLAENRIEINQNTKYILVSEYKSCSVEVPYWRLCVSLGSSGMARDLRSKAKPRRKRTFEKSERYSYHCRGPLTGRPRGSGWGQPGRLLEVPQVP